MKELSPLAQKYKDAFDGRLIVFDIDGLLFLLVFNIRNFMVVLDGYTCFSSCKTKTYGICRFVKFIILEIITRCGEEFDFFPEVREILLALYEAEIPIALASSTWAPKLYDFFYC